MKQEAEIVSEQGGIPLVAKSARGLGEVWQTSFSLGDPALNGWERYDEWFAIMLSKTEPYFLLGQNNGDQSFLERIYYEVADSNELFPSTNFKVSTLVIILIVYLVIIVPLLYFLLRKMDKREQAWWIIPVISILVSSGIFITGAKDRISKPHLNQMNILKVEDDRSAHGISAFTALSNSGGDYDFVSDRNHLELTPARMRNNPGGGNQFKFAVEELNKDQRKITFRDVEYWSTRTVLGTSEREDLGKFIPELNLKDKTISGTIQNAFPYDFTDVYIWSGSRIYRVGEVKAGETLSVDKKLSTDYLSSPIGNPNMSAPFPNQQSIKQQKKERLENFASQMISSDNENNSPVIFGYTEAKILLLLVISSLPLYSFVFLFGGVSPSDLLTVFGYSLFLVFTFGSIGVFYSTVIRKTIVSMVTTYGTVLFLVGGTLFLFMLSMAIGSGPYQNQTSPVPYLIAMFNPAIVIMGHFEPMAIDEIYSRSGITFPLWISFLMIYSILAVISLSLSIMKLRPSMKVKSTNKG